MSTDRPIRDSDVPAPPEPPPAEAQRPSQLPAESPRSGRQVEGTEWEREAGDAGESDRY